MLPRIFHATIDARDGDGSTTEWGLYLTDVMAATRVRLVVDADGNVTRRSLHSNVLEEVGIGSVDLAAAASLARYIEDTHRH